MMYAKCMYMRLGFPLMLTISELDLLPYLHVGFLDVSVSARPFVDIHLAPRAKTRFRLQSWGI
jgi:hypothetical protein